MSMEALEKRFPLSREALTDEETVLLLWEVADDHPDVKQTVYGVYELVRVFPKESNVTLSDVWTSLHHFVDGVPSPLPAAVGDEEPTTGSLAMKERIRRAHSGR